MKTIAANKEQMSLIEAHPQFPSTRFQGSKLKIVDWIWNAIEHLDFHTALDAFGGTGSVAYMLKEKNKVVTYNDVLKFNWYIGLALIENDKSKLLDGEVDFILTKQKGIKYPTFVQDTFQNIYFTDEENQWIDKVATNIGLLDNIYKKAIGYFALFQTCIIKRPFNLFHRKNLYLRLSNVERNFGNKATWDTPADIHFRKFVYEANNAIFCNDFKHKALNFDVFDISEKFDMVYIDTPYISKNGVGVDYLSFYHFLEGLANYSKWQAIIDYQTKHKCLKRNGSIWNDKNKIHSAFDALFGKFKKSILVVSYRADGIPAIGELKGLLKKYKSEVIELKRKDYKYALSTNHSEEVLLLGK